jgi:hypothetical protein
MSENRPYRCKCLRCGYQWLSHSRAHKPCRCANPACRSPYWRISREDDYAGGRDAPSLVKLMAEGITTSEGD